MRAALVAVGVLCAACGGGAARGTSGAATPAPAPPIKAIPVDTAVAAPPARPAPGGGGITFRAAPTTPYVLVRHDTLVYEYLGGARQEQIRERAAYLSVSVAETGVRGRYLATIVLDSITATENGVPVLPDSLARARGTRWTATLSSIGEMSGIRADRASLLGSQIAGSLRLLFPRLPAGGVRVGMEWTDSSRSPVQAGAFQTSEEAVTTYRAAENEQAPVGRVAVRLESSGTYSRAGALPQQGDTLKMTGSGTRRAVYYLHRDGLLVAAEGSDSGEMAITVPAMGQTVPVKESGTYSLHSLAAPAR